MVMLRAFADDSSGETGDRRLFLAGFINSAEKWAEFSDAWEEERKRSPVIEYCHMVEAQNRRGQFEGWEEAKRDEKILALASVIRRYKPWSVHCSVSRDEYRAILAPATAWPFKNPYFACFIGIITAAAQYHEQLGFQNAPVVDFVFDEQQGLGEQALLWYAWLKKKSGNHVRRALGSTPMFFSDTQVVALQAADMLAWHIRRLHEVGDEGRPATDLLLQHHGGLDIDAASLRLLAEQHKAIPGIGGVQSKKDWRRVHRTIQGKI